MQLGSISKLLAKSPYKDKAKEIEAEFKVAGVDSLDKLDNGPRFFGKSVAGYSTYQVCAFVREAAIEEAMKPVQAPEPKTSDAGKAKEKIQRSSK